MMSIFLIRLFTYSLSKNDRDYLFSTAKQDLALITGDAGLDRPEALIDYGIEILVTKAK